MTLSNKLSYEAGSFYCHLNPHRIFHSEVLRLYFPMLEPWVAWSVSLPSCSSHFICTHMWDHLVCQLLPRPLRSSSYHVAVHPLHPRCPSLPLLSVWMNVSSLTPWLLDFHTVRFSGSYGCFLFLNWLLSFFWLCEEAQYIYLGLHLGQNPSLYFFLVLSPTSAVLDTTV